MKKIIFIILVFTIVLQVNAQKTDSLIYRQLNLEGIKAQRMAGWGMTLTILGSIGIASGIIIDRNNSDIVKPITGTIVSEIGACMFSIGVPLWLIEVSKMNHIEIEMIKYKGPISAGGLGFKMRF